MDILLPSDIKSSPTPSRVDGVQECTEIRQKCFGAELIQEANILLRMGQNVAVTAANIFHRFYYRKSLLRFAFKKRTLMILITKRQFNALKSLLLFVHRFDVFTVSMGCVLLASKIEEDPKVLREIIYVFNHVSLSSPSSSFNFVSLFLDVSKKKDARVCGD